VNLISSFFNIDILDVDCGAAKLEALELSSKSSSYPRDKAEMSQCFSLLWLMKVFIISRPPPKTASFEIQQQR